MNIHNLMENKNSIGRLPVWLRVSGYFIVIISAARLAGILPVLDSIFMYFGVALVLSYLLLKADRRPLSSLGFIPVGKTDWMDFVMGLALGVTALLVSAGLTIWLNGSCLVATGRIDPIFISILILTHLFSSFVQEFTYRGYPFQRLHESYGPGVAQFAVTLPFAIMHLKFDGTLSWQQFLMTWLTTGLGSMLYGLCYLKSGKLILSIAVHFGWNLAQSLVPRSPEKNKTMLFTLLQDPNQYQMINVLLPYIIVTLILMLFIWRSKAFKKVRQKPETKLR